MKRILNKLFSKLVLGGLIIILQFSWFVYLLYSATVYSSMVDALFKIASIVLALFVSSRDMRSTYKTSWIFLILALPLFGIPAYYLFGRPGLTKRTRMKMDVVSSRIRAYSSPSDDVMSALRAEDDSAGQQAQYLTRYAGYPVYREADTQYYCCGEEMYPQFLEDLKTAKSYIFLEYFIAEPGKMLDAIVEILAQKAKEGVDVRFMYDGIGCIQTLPNKYYCYLQEKGIKCACFQPFRPLMSIIQNNRDHRKITVIDGKVAYTGGMNLADEYINARVRFGYWKDAAIRLTGECVWSFTSMFLELWDYILKIESDYTFYRATSMEKHRLQEKIHADKKGFVQPYTDSPLDHEDVGENVYLNIISRAKKYLYIFTPYLIIGSEMRTALVNAAKSGVDVRLVVPGIPDKKLVYFLTQSNFPYLIKNGVKIYTYTPGFIHAKCFVSDDVQATVGTVNMDYRSLCLHFECGVWMYRTRAVLQVKEDALKTFAESHEVTLEEFQRKSFLVRTFMGALKLFAPLL